MGSGKTTVGKQLAKKFDFTFVDIDNYIELKYKTSINDFFSKFGENKFREIEKEELENISTKKNIVVATGGGTPCFFNNIDIINKTGTSIYIKLSPEMLLSRLKNAKENRPLINKKSDIELLEFIKSTLQKREKYYKKAKIIIESKNLKINELIKKIDSLSLFTLLTQK